jgi:DNA-binding transcriptional LysR family regulator
MDIRHLRYLIAVAEEESFSGAAARLHLAQPALSRQIQDLERELGVTLFTRSSSGTQLTAAGESAARCARRIVDDVRLAVERTRHAERGLAGVCVVGAGRYPLWNGLIANLIGQIRAEYPGIEIVVDDRSLPAQWNALASAELDLTFGTAPPSDFAQFAVETHSLDVIDSVAVSRAHALAASSSVTLKDLERHTWIRHAPSVRDEPTRILQSVFLAHAFAPLATRHAANDDAVRMLVRAGAGWCALPHSLRAILPHSLVAIPVEDLAVPFRYVHAHRRGDTRPVIRSVLSALRRAAQRHAVTRRDFESPTPDRSPAIASAGAASRLELRHLRYFVAVVDHESFGRAADELGITQPALSRQIRDLETEVGASLLQRTARGARPTLAGETFYSHASGILKRTERVGLEALRAQRGISGRCVIGVAASPIIWDVVTRVLAAVGPDAAAVDIIVEDVPTPRQPAALAEGHLDLSLGHVGVAPPDIGPGLVRQVLVADTLNLALVSVAHPLARRSELSLKDLADAPFLFIKRQFSPSFYDDVMAAFARANHIPNIEAAYDGLQTIWALAAQGHGWCLGGSLQRSEPPAGLVGIPLKDFSLPWGCELFQRRDETRASVLNVLRLLREAAQSSALAA